MKYLIKYKFEILIILLISALFLLLRLPNLTLQPIFADEAIYIRWAQVMRAEPSLRFLPLSDGKTPLFMWMMIPLFKIFDDPLFAGRILSIMSGFATLIGVLLLGWRFFNRRVGLWAGLLVAATPYMVFFDRLALVDSMLTAFSVWSLNISLLLLKYQRIDLAILLGYFLGASLLTKPPGFFNILLLPLTLINFNWKALDRQRQFLKIFGLWIIAIATTLGIYNILRLGSGFTNLNSRNQDYVHSPAKLLATPFDPFIPHFWDIVDWFPKLFGYPILTLILIGILVVVILRSRVGLIVLLWGLGSLIIQTAMLKTFTARYILFSIPMLLVTAALAVDFLSQRIKLSKLKSIAIFTLIILGSTLGLDYFLLTDPAKAWLPRTERMGYLEQWTAGYGFPEIAKFLIEKSNNGLVVVGTDGSFGTLPDGLQIYLDKHSHSALPENQIIVIGDKGVITEQIRNAAFEHETYYIANRPIDISLPEGVEKVMEFPKIPSAGGRQEAIFVLKILPVKVSTPSAQINE